MGPTRQNIFYAFFAVVVVAAVWFGLGIRLPGWLWVAHSRPLPMDAPAIQWQFQCSTNNPQPTNIASALHSTLIAVAIFFALAFRGTTGHEKAPLAQEASSKAAEDSNADLKVQVQLCISRLDAISDEMKARTERDKANDERVRKAMGGLAQVSKQVTSLRADSTHQQSELARLEAVVQQFSLAYNCLESRMVTIGGAFQEHHEGFRDRLDEVSASLTSLSQWGNETMHRFEERLRELGQINHSQNLPTAGTTPREPNFTAEREPPAMDEPKDALCSFLNRQRVEIKGDQCQLGTDARHRLEFSPTSGERGTVSSEDGATIFS